MPDLSGLIEKHGEEEVATAGKMSVRRLKDIQSGIIALTGDDIYELLKVFKKTFSVSKTVESLGEMRDENKTSRKYSPKRAVNRQTPDRSTPKVATRLSDFL